MIILLLTIIPVTHSRIGIFLAVSQPCHIGIDGGYSLALRLCPCYRETPSLT